MKYLTLLSLLLANSLFARPVKFVVADVFGSAKFVGIVVIINYDGKGQIEFRSIEYKDTITTADCGCSLTNGYNFPYKPSENYWTANLPFIGDTVLVAIDGYNRPRIFGKRTGQYYRLWSPVMSGSIAIFEFEKPLQEINTDNILRKKDSITACWDGCLLPITALRSLVKNYKQRFDRKLTTCNIAKYNNREVFNIFYDDTLKYFNNHTWTDEPPGKLQSLVLKYSNGSSLEIFPVIDEENPRQFNANKQFDMEKFKKMKILEIKWIQ